ncbi:MmpL domain-containing protein [Candidatus Protofrankia datiscae]|uniref:MmpL domain-containing protein n=2 Tax=Candidatus Protofrankia datiscae TaxID=2716812 RepID=F8AVD2_9ACTN|nr:MULTISPECIES: MMPL family transporter [Protofrankia]AEH08228.1 MmpL domain-containing protein [Candidatus Protofrankia datiscae]
MFARLARLVTRRPGLVLLATLLLVGATAVLGVTAFGKLQTGGFDDPRSGSTHADQAVEERFGGQPSLVLLVTARAGTVDAPDVTAAGRELTRTLAAEPGVNRAVSYWDSGGPPLRSESGRHALVLAYTSDDDVAEDLVARYEQARDVPGPVTVTPGGAATIGENINDQVTTDLALAESVAIPITMVLLIVAFGGVVAALLPLAVGVVGIFGGLAILSVLGSLTDVSIFAVNLTTALGLGLGIDYALLMVSRFREELASGRDRADAVATTLRTAGRTIVFSGATVVAALAVMLVFPPYFLKSMAYAGIAVTVFAVLSATVVLPAILVLLGPRVNALRVGGLIGLIRRRRAAGAAAGPREASESPAWRAVASAVMRRPLLVGVPAVAVLLMLGIPFLHVSFGTPDDRVLRGTASSRQVGDVIRTDFAADTAAATTVVLEGAAGGPGGGAPAGGPAPDGYARDLSSLPNVARVNSAAGTYAAGRQVTPPAPTDSRFSAGTSTYLEVVPSVDPASDAGQDLARAVRGRPVPAGTSVLVGGPSAVLVDGKATISDHLPLAVGLIALTTFVLLFLFTGSVVMPLKALVLNALSLSAVLGAAVWVFQDGHLSGALGFLPGPLDTSMPVLLFCIAFGLSMDYEVFLLSRIKEEHDRGVPNTEAVATGLARTGRIVTTAAALLAVTFVAFATSSVTFMQMFGIGTALAIVLDATLIRGVLVPAFMRLAGNVNWWAPRPLRALHARIGLVEAPRVEVAYNVPVENVG